MDAAPLCCPPGPPGTDDTDALKMAEPGVNEGRDPDIEPTDVSRAAAVAADAAIAADGVCPRCGDPPTDATPCMDDEEE